MRGVQVVTAAVAATCLVASMPAVAADAAAGVDVASAYIFRGATVLDEVVVQPYLEGAFYGVTVGTWANFNTDSSQFDEIDYYASYELPLGEAAPVGVTIGYTEYTYPTAVDELGAGLEADREASIGACWLRRCRRPSRPTTASRGRSWMKGSTSNSASDTTSK